MKKQSYGSSMNPLPFWPSVLAVLFFASVSAKTFTLHCAVKMGMFNGWIVTLYAEGVFKLDMWKLMFFCKLGKTDPKRLPEFLIVFLGQSNLVVTTGMFFWQWRKIVWRGPVRKIRPKCMILVTSDVIWGHSGVILECRFCRLTACY